MTFYFRLVDQNYLESSKMYCWRSWTNRVKNEEVFHKVRDERKILNAIKRRKATCIDHILRKNCLLKHVIEGKAERRIDLKTKKKTSEATG